MASLSLKKIGRTLLPLATAFGVAAYFTANPGTTLSGLQIDEIVWLR